MLLIFQWSLVRETFTTPRAKTTAQVLCLTAVFVVGDRVSHNETRKLPCWSEAFWNRQGTPSRLQKDQMYPSSSHASLGKELFLTAVNGGGAAMEEFFVCMRVIRASDLPKTDRFIGKIDPYVILSSSSGKARTSTINRDYNPVWNEVINLKSGDAELQIDLFDEDVVSSDDLVGTCRIPLISSMPVGKPQSFDLQILKGKEKGRARVEVMLLWKIRTPRAIASRMPSAFIRSNDVVVTRVPDMPGQDAIYVSVEFEKGGLRVDVRVLETSLPSSLRSLWVQIFGGNEKGKPTKLRYQEFTNAPKLINGVMTWRETKIDDVPIHLVTGLQIRISQVESVVYDSTLNSLAQEHGWQGSLSYTEARRTLRNCKFDDSSKKAFFIEESRGFAFQNDWDSDNCDLAVFAFSNFSSAGCVVDMTHQKTTKRTHRIYQAHLPKHVLGFAMGQEAELDDLPLPCSLNDVKICVRRLSQNGALTLPLSSIFPLT